MDDDPMAGRLAALRSAVVAALAAAGDGGNPVETTRRLGQVAGLIDTVANGVSDARGYTAAQAHDQGQAARRRADRTSLIKLAATWGISKQRASQLVAAGRKHGRPVDQVIASIASLSR
jgi:hypothetical protein